jgi:CTP:molybdopterin cytidylyltransferase MocA
LDPMALAILAAQTLVAAASTDAWGVLKRCVVRLLGRGDAEREQLALSQLDQTWQQIQTARGPESERLGAELEAAWQARLFSLLEAQPDVADDLLALVQKVRPTTGTIAAADHSIAGARDVTITASQGSVAAGVIHGKVSLGPTLPGPANT